jgi:hypothetical protein
VAKRRVGKYPKEFRRMAVERLKTCDNIASSEAKGVEDMFGLIAAVLIILWLPRLGSRGCGWEAACFVT